MAVRRINCNRGAVECRGSRAIAMQKSRRVRVSANIDWLAAYGMLHCHVSGGRAAFAREIVL
jgi:hypothetical protein